MKKGFLKKAGIMILTFTILFAAGCKNEPDYKGAGYTDQQITLGTPSVQGKAYPGVNYIYWDRVANAINGYTLSIYEDGVLTNTTPITLGQFQTYYIDTNVKYNVEKTYKVRAIGDSAGRYVIYTESNTGSVKLTPIVPPTDTSALELAKYEKGYKEGKDYTLSESDAEYQLSEESITVQKNEAEGNFTVTFPVKAYLTYTVYADYGNTYDVTGVHEYTVGTYQDFAVNNKTATIKGVATVSGDYNIYVKASAYNTKYFNKSDDIKSATGLSYSTLALSSSYTATSIAFNYKDETTLDVTWQPAILADGTYAKASYYKIYKTVAGLTNYEPVEAEIKVVDPISSNVPVYKITDITDDSAYKYLFVLTDGVRYARFNSSVTVSNAITDISGSSILITWKDAENDAVYNDACVLVSLADDTKTLSAISYGTADNSSDAWTIADEGTNALTVNGSYRVYEFTINNVTEDVGTYLYVKAVISEKGKKDNYISNWTIYSKDTALAPTAKEASLLALDEDRIPNDLYATIEIYKNQRISSLYYSTATTAEYNAYSAILTERLDSASAGNVTNDITEKYRTDEKIVYQVIINDFEIGDYIALHYVVSEIGKSDYEGNIITGPVKETLVTPEQTAAPVLSTPNLYFTAWSYDANYNDIEGFNISIDVNQTIKSIRYAYAENRDKINELLRTDSSAAIESYIPDNYNLVTTVSGATATLTKVYWYSVASDIPDGNMVGMEITISEPGYEDYVRTIYTAATSYNYTNPITGEIETEYVNEYAEQKPVQKALLTVDDGNNWEYVHVIANDYFYYDDISNYTYKLERTLEKWYYDSEAIWETIEENITFYNSYNYGNYYTFDKWYDYNTVDVGTYVYRLTKTRKADVSVTGEEEAAVTDANVNVVYHVALDTFGFSDYSSENLTLSYAEYIDPNYDDIEKYTYNFMWFVEYYDAYGNVTYSRYKDDGSGDSEWTEFEGWSWTKEKNAEGNETGYYLLTGAVIPAINKVDAVYAKVHIGIWKGRNDTNESVWVDNWGNELLLNWGITASIAPDSTLALSTPYTYYSGAETYVHVETSVSGYDSYTWYLDGEEITGWPHTVNGSSVELNDSWLSAGSHEIIVVAKDGSIPYSATVTYIK